MPNIRQSYIFITAFCAFAIIAALIMQYQFSMEPCPLCISQRIFIILVGIMAFIGAIVSNSHIGNRISASLGIVFAFIGGMISARHVWIQNLPEDEVPLCGPGLTYMFETRPVFDALGVLFAGDGHCADVNFSLLGLSIPGWTLVLFITLALLLAWIGFYKPKNHSA